MAPPPNGKVESSSSSAARGDSRERQEGGRQAVVPVIGTDLVPVSANAGCEFATEPAFRLM